jgi:hypothetical protein
MGLMCFEQFDLDHLNFFQTGTRTASKLLVHLTFIVLSILLRQVAVGILLAQIQLDMLLLMLPELLLMMEFCKPVCRDRIIGPLTPVSSIQGNNINGISFSTLNATTSGSGFLLVFRS